MRARVEPGLFELPSHLSKCATRVVCKRDGAAVDHTVDVEHPEANAFHMERTDRDAQRRAFFEKTVARRALWLCRDAGDEGLEALFGRFSRIGSRHKNVVTRWHEDGSLIAMPQQARKVDLENPRQKAPCPFALAVV